MGFSPEQIGQLTASLASGAVKQREQAGRKLSYIEGWHAIAEANRIFGFDGWDRETVDLKEVCRIEKTDKYGKPQWKVGYEAKVRVKVYGEGFGGYIVREGTGHGQGTMGDLFDAIESAAKEAETDAMKRALMTFGNQFGLALYDKEQRNVEHEAPKPAVKQRPELTADEKAAKALHWAKSAVMVASHFTENPQAVKDYIAENREYIDSASKYAEAKAVLVEGGLVEA